MKAYVKLFFELMPLIIFFYCNTKYGIFTATIAFMVTAVIAVPAAWFLDKKLPIMPLVTGAFVLTFGGLTIFFQDESFIKIKPTIINIIFATILLIGLKFNKLLLKYAMGKAFKITNNGWKKLTLRWSLFFLFLAIVNEVVWRTQTTDFWVSFKVFGIMPLTLVFAMCQLPLVNKETIKSD